MLKWSDIVHWRLAANTASASPAKRSSPSNDAGIQAERYACRYCPASPRLPLQ
ncbi:MAG: hypothetical protein H0W36_15855 [Gemmatimonadetes bacterium]|nr:hypothetical protein [Gemmatimonadota bacterium]